MLYQYSGKEKGVNFKLLTSLLNFSCIFAYKVMESLIRDQLTTVLQEGRLLTKTQHEFAKEKSCLANFLETFEDWTRAVDEDYGIAAIYLD